MIPFPLLASSFESVFHFFQQGGFFMALLVICSLVSFTVIVLRGLALRRDFVMPPTLENEIEAIGPGDADAADRLGRLTNRMRHCGDCPPWTFGTSHLMRNLARRGLI